MLVGTKSLFLFVALVNMELVKNFKSSKILNQDPVAHSLVLLGSCDGNTAILILKKTAFQEQQDYALYFERLESVEKNDIYHVLQGWIHNERSEPDVKVDLICPATEVHIRKHTQQQLTLVRETPDIYAKIVRPYIESFPPERTSWVDNILSHKSEAEKILYTDDDFVILPDFKWDLKDVTTLYLQAITRHKRLRSLRDIRFADLGMLRQIRRQAYAAVQQFGIRQGGLRLYVHYQPSYYHFHVHIVQVNYSGFSGMNVGQAHLLDDIISLLEMDGVREEGQSVFERMTFSYTLGQFHGLYDSMVEANKWLE